MKSAWFLAAAIILPTIRFVNAAEGSKVDRLSLKHFAEQAIEESKPHQMSIGLSKFLDVPAGAPTRYRDIDEEDTLDGAAHGFQLVLSTGNEVNAIIFRVSRMQNESISESYFFKFDSDGVLDRVVVGLITYRDDKVVRGSGRSEVISADAPGVQKKLQHELDFWLKGKYRKKKSVSN